jgi:hypothetical protein
MVMSDRSRLVAGSVKVGVMAALALAAGSAVGQNLIVNPSFEDQPVELNNDVFGAQGWTAFERAFTTFYLARTGDQSFKTFSPFLGAASGIFQEFPTSGGQTYTASVWGSNPSFDALGADQAGFMNVEWFDSVGRISFDSVRVVAGHLTPADSQYYNGSMVVTAPAGATTARFVLLTGAFFDANGDGVTTGGGAVYFDDASFSLGAPEPKWLTDGSGNWEDSVNWQGGVPNAAGAAANFVTLLTNPSTVTLGSGKTVGTVTFSSVAPYTVGGAALTLDNGGGAAVVEQVSGSHVINSDVLAVNGLSVLAGNGALTLGGKLDVQGKLEVASGELRLAAGTSEMNELLVAEDGVLNAESGSLLIDYSGASPIGTVIGYLLSGQLIADGDFGGLPTYLAIAEAADLGLTEFDGITIDETTVIAKFTYVGDANLDGQVDALDYERVDLAIGNSGVFGTAQGDLNYDGAVDALDYEQIDLNIGNGVGSPLAGVFIPEPSSLGLVLGGGLIGLRRRR